MKKIELATEIRNNHPNKQEILEDIVAASERFLSCDIKISVYDLATKESFSVKGDKKGWAASIIKLPIMVAAMREIYAGRMSGLEALPIDHKYTLESFDQVSLMPGGKLVNIFSLMDYMIVNSDNEATNMIGAKIGVPKINRYMWELGMNHTMLGHLLCRGVPRYKHPGINPDGSNVTTTNDMVCIMRHIYDSDFSEIPETMRIAADGILSRTGCGFLRSRTLKGHEIKSKTGYISGPEDGTDIHDVSIIDDEVIVAMMVNKIRDYKGKIKIGEKKGMISSLDSDPYGLLSIALDKYFLKPVLTLASNSYDEDYFRRVNRSATTI